MKPTSEENATLPRIQAYSKSQLATLYLPHIQPASARRTLRSWIAKNTALQNELARTGYSEKAILLTPAQVELHLPFLGGALIRADYPHGFPSLREGADFLVKPHSSGSKYISVTPRPFQIFSSLAV
ncbi:DUF4248 domain-containing protein [Bacteroides thetaiotaomicron]|nr:DUF4248 domain-containing protein [Bacteroides thetaiotaomicron]